MFTPSINTPVIAFARLQTDGSGGVAFVHNSGFFLSVVLGPAVAEFTVTIPNLGSATAYTVLLNSATSTAPVEAAVLTYTATTFIGEVTGVNIQTTAVSIAMALFTR